METREEEEFAGRSVVITGAADGIGIVLVQRFLTRGARVFGVDRDQDAPDRLQAEHGKGFTAGADDLETLTALIGHPPRRYEGFVRETATKWDKDLP